MADKPRPKVEFVRKERPAHAPNGSLRFCDIYYFMVGKKPVTVSVNGEAMGLIAARGIDVEIAAKNIIENALDELQEQDIQNHWDLTKGIVDWMIMNKLL